ncbi:MAG: transposase [Phycisphaerae bacterium]|nr:transposase [Phycisphaerae bacterium]
MQTISAWTLILQQVFPIFTRPGANIFSALLTGWILCTARRTVTAMIPLADPFCCRAHDAYHRFFPDAKFSLAELWKILARLLIAMFTPKGVIPLALDDTLFHRSGRKVNGAGYWRDAVRSTKTKIVYAWGLNLAVLTLQVQPPWGGEPLGLPINMRLHRKNEKTLIELAAEMIEEVAAWCPSRKFRVVADALGLWLYSTVWLWFCKQPAAKRRFRILPWYANKTTPSFADALGSLRRTLWKERFIMMFGDHVAHDKKYRFLLEALAPAA